MLKHDSPDCPGVLNMTIAIVLATKNDSRLSVTLESLLAQDAGDFQLIVVNGGQPLDGLDARLLKALDGRELMQTGTGIYGAMNEGIRAAAADWIYFLNCGDQLLGAHALARCQQELAEANRRSAELVFFRLIVDETGLSVPALPVRTSLWLVFGAVCHQAVVYRRAALERLGGYDESYRFCADKLSVLRLLRSGVRTYSSPVHLVIWQSLGICSLSPLAFEDDNLHFRSSNFTPAEQAVGWLLNRVVLVLNCLLS
jgi:putative colanic acid biosynthesis glycosyltransferase